MMRFEARDLKEFAEPISMGALEIGATYFSVQFVDEKGLIPVMETLVFVGREVVGNGQVLLRFQDFESYHAGVQFDAPDTVDAVFYSQPEDQVKHIFEFDKALDRLLACSIRRSTRGDV